MIWLWEGLWPVRQIIACFVVKRFFRHFVWLMIVIVKILWPVRQIIVCLSWSDSFSVLSDWWSWLWRLMANEADWHETILSAFCLIDDRDCENFMASEADSCLFVMKWLIQRVVWLMIWLWEGLRPVRQIIACFVVKRFFRRFDWLMIVIVKILWPVRQIIVCLSWSDSFSVLSDWWSWLWEGLWPVRQIIACFVMKQFIQRVVWLMIVIMRILWLVRQIVACLSWSDSFSVLSDWWSWLWEGLWPVMQIIACFVMKRFIQRVDWLMIAIVRIYRQ